MGGDCCARARCDRAAGADVEEPQAVEAAAEIPDGDVEVPAVRADLGVGRLERWLQLRAGSGGGRRVTALQVRIALGAGSRTGYGEEHEGEPECGEMPHSRPER